MGSGSISPSESMTTASTGLSPVSMTLRISATVPETEACMGALTYPSLSPTICPRYTWSPFFTTGLQGAPICCCMGSITRSGGGMVFDGSAQVFLWWGTGAPPWVLKGRFGKRSPACCSCIKSTILSSVVFRSQKVNNFILPQNCAFCNHKSMIFRQKSPQKVKSFRKEIAFLGRVCYNVPKDKPGGEAKDGDKKS